MSDSDSFNTKLPPFETAELLSSLTDFMSTEFCISNHKSNLKIGQFKWGVYAFFDYDDEPIYVGQTRESVSARVGRHLTGQRTDAVAKSVLDPLEVKEIEIWPLPQFQNIPKDQNARAIQHLAALEYSVHQNLIKKSRFGAILNEKDPAKPTANIGMPASFRGRIVSDNVLKIRAHPDFRIHRRAMIIAKLSQGIAERKIIGGDSGLRRVLLTQSKRLQWLAEQRFKALL